MKILRFNGQDFKAERIIKNGNTITGYVQDREAFKITNITDFTMFELLDGATYDIDPKANLAPEKMRSDIDYLAICLGVTL